MAIKSNVVRSQGVGFKKNVFNRNTKGNVIIQCPKCQTKFSVSSELISELELPRFHCSRCDNVFDMDPRSDASFEENDIPKNSDTLSAQEDPFKPNTEIKSDYTEAAFTPEVAKTNTEQESAFEEKRNTSTIEVSKEELKRITSAVISEATKEDEAKNKAQEIKETTEFSFEPPPAPKSLEIPKTFSPSTPVSPPIENSTTNFSTFSKYEPLKAEQLSMDLPANEYDTDKTEETMPYGISFGSPVSKEAQNELSDLRPPSFSQDEQESNVFLKNSWSSLTVFFMPVLFTLICSGLLSILLIKSPQIAEAVASNIGMPLPQPAPAGLYIDDIKYSKLTLDNGESIFAISGKIKNDSQKKFKNILLEGFLFDTAGNISDSVKASAASGLDISRIKSLSAEMINNMQNQKASKRYELNPGSMQEFVIAINSSNSTKAQSDPEYFSARIHSVTAN